MPTAVLSNGLRVANFSSPHPFKFVDGTEIPACSPERAKGLMLIADEKVGRVSITTPKGVVEVENIDLEFRLSDSVEKALLEAMNSRADIILVPFPVLRAMKDAGISIGRCRVIRVADRVTKAIHVDKFCV